MKLSRLILAILFVLAGANHFRSPAVYMQLMPPLLPAPLLLIWISGVAEILGGLGILFAATRRLAAIGLILLLLAVFPANIYGALHGMQLSGREVPAWLLWWRLPFQAVFIAWVYFVALKPEKLPR